LLAKSSPKKGTDEPLKKGRPERHLQALLGDKHKAFFLLGKPLLYREKECLGSSFASSFLSSILIEIIEEFNNLFFWFVVIIGVEIPRLRSGGQKLGRAAACPYKIVMETPRLTALGELPTLSCRAVARHPRITLSFRALEKNLPVVGKD
jgi:hypothetical protein